MLDLVVVIVFLDILNYVYSVVSFIMEVEENGMFFFFGLQFLNCVLCVEIKVYVKLINIGFFLYYYSYVDSCYKQGLFVIMFDCVYWLLLFWIYFLEECECLRGVF